jgi:DNA polymerase I
VRLDELPFREVLVVDYEFTAPTGERPLPICVVVRELKTGRTIRVWEDEFGPSPPYPTGPDSLSVAFFASADLGCHLALGWPMPERILHLFCEHRCLTNGVRHRPPHGRCARKPPRPPASWAWACWRRR